MRCRLLSVAVLGALALSCKPKEPPAPAAPASAAPAPTPATAPTLTRGDPAPDFSLQGSDGKTHALADHKGKQAVVIAWFPKAFTGG
jgi:hypothetical protein